MQNKGLIKLFAFLFGIVSIYQLSFTFITSKVEQDSVAFAAAKIADTDADYLAKRGSEETAFLDSVSNNPIFGFTSYADAKKKELNKGLDLKGGINVTLQISVKDILKGLANNSKNPVFNKALADADNASKSSDDTYLNLFFESFDAIKGDTKLADPSIFANKALSDAINFQMSDDEVRPILSQKIDESIVSAFEVLRERIDGFGVTQPNIQREGNSGRILVELPGVKDIARAQDLLSSTAQLEFWETYPPNNQDIASFFVAANERLKSLVVTEKETQKPASEIDSLLADVAQDSLANQQNPLIDLIRGQGQGYETFKFSVRDTATVGAYLRMKEIRRLIPASLALSLIHI